MMSGLQLLSAGENIRIWDVGGYTQLSQFNPHAGNVSCISWSHDNTCLASTSVCGDKICLTYPKAASYSYDIAVGEKRTCHAFNSTSRYIMGGGPDGVVYVWDLKTRKCKNSYKDHKSPITSLQFNWDDAAIASGAENGDIIVYNVKTAVGSSPLRSSKTQAIRELQYSHFKKSLLASVSDDGGVYLWDTNARRLLHSFGTMHQAPATGVAFSPLNEMLLMTVGLDKKIICYDVQGKAPVRTMQAESPLTSIDLCQDGATLAVGSNRGKIYIYDLRQGATPVRVMAEHKASVQGLKFQRKFHKVDSTGNSKLRASTATADKKTLPTGGSSNTANSKGMPASNGVARQHHGSKEDTHMMTLNHTKGSSQLRRDSGHLAQDIKPDVFSPIHDPLSSYGIENMGLASDSGKKERCVTKQDTLRNQSTEQLYSDGVFSPLAGDVGVQDRRHPSDLDYPQEDGDYQYSQSVDYSRRRANRGSGASPRNFDLQQQLVLPSDTNDPSRSSSRSSFLGDVPPSGIQMSHTAEPTVDAVQRLVETKLQEEPKMPPSSLVAKVAETSQTSTPLSSATAPPHQHSLQTATTPPDAFPSDGVAADAAAAGPIVAQPFQTQFLRNLIREELEDVRDQMREDILNLHMEMLKQFHLCEVHTQALVEQHSINGELLAEIERLREENAKLRKTF